MEPAWKSRCQKSPILRAHRLGINIKIQSPGQPGAWFVSPLISAVISYLWWWWLEGTESLFKNIQNSFLWNTTKLESIFQEFWWAKDASMVVHGRNILRSALSWDVMQRTVVIPYRHFGTTYWSHLHRSRNPRRKGPLKKGPIGYPQHQ
jgi:hypothetical protein